MRNVVARLGPAIIRVFSTGPPRYDTSRNSRHIASAYKQTKHPLWRLLDALRQPRHGLPLSEALHRNKISADEYENWKTIIHDSTIEAVSPEAPSWVVLYLINNKVRSSQQASGPMLDLVNSHLNNAPREIHGPLILLAAIQLARFNLVVPLLRLAQTFLRTWIERPSVYFNLLLQVVSSIPNRTVESANIAVLLLKAMESRQLKLTSDTYEALLNDRFVTLQLTKYLQTRMVQEGFIPQTAHLEAYLRFFAKDGAIYDAKQYYRAIHAQELNTSPPPDPSSVPPLKRANTLMLGGFTSVPPAFGFLRKLANMPSPTVVPPSSVPRKIRTLARLMRTKFLSVHDLTAALCVAVRDSRCTPSDLMKLFTRTPGGRPSVATYTILIRGLLLRGDAVNAVSYWKKLLKSGVAIDSEALATGVVALTRVGRPLDAFVLLEQHGARSDDIDGVEDLDTIPKLRRPVKVTQKTINDFMVALNRIQRPDIVFRIWDHMDKLYNVQPNALSLSILLQSARLAHKLDDTLSGALAHLSLKNPFRRNKHKPLISPSSTARRDAVLAIRTLLYDDTKHKPVGYASGIWNQELPAPAVRKVFLRALFGMVLEREEDGMAKVEEMLCIEAPANATRKSIDDDPASRLGLPQLRPVKFTFEPFEDLFYSLRTSSSATTAPIQNTPTHPRLRSHYPSILITNATILNYILLLVLDSRVTEIPLVLAWMRYLRIQPSSSTLALALAAWSEVSVQAPLLEEFAAAKNAVLRSVGGSNSQESLSNDEGGTERLDGRGKEYTKLVNWIREWVGEKRVPSVREVGKWERVVLNVRERVGGEMR